VHCAEQNGVHQRTLRQILIRNTGVSQACRRYAGFNVHRHCCHVQVNKSHSSCLMINTHRIFYREKKEIVLFLAPKLEIIFSLRCFSSFVPNERAMIICVIKGCC
jgi:hypothetical protein